MPRKKGLKWYDYIILFIFLVLVFIPDPTDVADVGLPIVEPLLAFGYYYLRTKGVLS